MNGLKDKNIVNSKQLISSKHSKKGENLKEEIHSQMKKKKKRKLKQQGRAVQNLIMGPGLSPLSLRMIFIPLKFLLGIDTTLCYLVQQERMLSRSLKLQNQLTLMTWVKQDPILQNRWAWKRWWTSLVKVIHMELHQEPLHQLRPLRPRPLSPLTTLLQCSTTLSLLPVTSLQLLLKLRLLNLLNLHIRLPLTLLLWLRLPHLIVILI